MRLKFALLTAVCALSACQGEDNSCEKGWERRDGACVDPLHIYEPEERLDFDNVVGGVADIPDLPPPPRSGFRVVVSDIELGPYDRFVVVREIEIPPTVNRMLYAAEVVPASFPYVLNFELLLSDSRAIIGDVRTGWLPSNFIHSVDYSRIMQEAVAGKGLKTSMIFSGSTSTCDHGVLCRPPYMALSEGHGMDIHPDHRIVFGAHYLNPTELSAIPMLVFDFYTAPSSDIGNEVVPFAFQLKDFDVPQQSELNVEGECSFPASMEIASLALVKPFHYPYRIQLKKKDGILSTLAPDETDYKDEVLYIKPDLLSVNADDSLRFSCYFNNPLDTPLVQGPQQGVECMLMGWMTPPEAQVVGIVPAPGEPCQTHLLIQP